MEVFRRTAGQFRFTFFTHSIADAGPEELERRVGNDGHIDEGMDRRLVEIVVAGKGFIGFVHDSQGRRRSTVGSQRRESEQGLASPISDDFTGVDGTAAADGEDQVSILDGLFTEQAVDVFIRRIVAVPEYAEDFQVRLGDGIEQRLFGLGQGRLAADDDNFFAEMTGNLADSIISVDTDGKSRQNQGIVSLRHDKNLL